jgi:EF hand
MKFAQAALASLIVISCSAAMARDNPTVAPPSAGPHGPMSSADHNRDGTVTHAEWEDFLRDGVYRRYGFLNYFDMLDVNSDGFLDAAERARAEPSDTYNDVDFNHDGLVSRAEAERQVAGRLYRKLPGEEFFKLLDLNGDNQITPDEIAVAHKKGLLPDR